MIRDLTVGKMVSFLVKVDRNIWKGRESLALYGLIIVSRLNYLNYQKYDDFFRHLLLFSYEKIFEQITYAICSKFV